MSRPEWGPLARGIFIALLWSTLIVVALLAKGLIGPWFLFAYAGMLLFLGLGLAAFLEKTGSYSWLLHFRARLRERLDRNLMRNLHKKVERQRRDSKLRKSRLRHPDLPRNW